VFAVLGVSLTLAFALALYVYQRYVSYVPRVTRHMPSEYALALRLDIEQAVVYEPFRRHLLPLIEASRTQDPTGGRKSVSRLQALRDQTTIELGVDLRELGIAVDRAGHWVVLLGGHFRRDEIVSGVARMLQREGIPVRLGGSPQRLVHQSGAAFAAADDGVLVLAQTEELLDRVLATQPERPELRAGTALAVAFGADDVSAWGGARLAVFPGQEFRAELVLPQAPELGEEALVALASGKTGDFKLLSGSERWQVRRDDGAPVRAATVLSRVEFDRLVANLASGLARLMGVEAPATAADLP